MTDDGHLTPSPMTALSVFLAGIAGAVIVGLKPVLLSSYVSHVGIDEIVAGYLISIEVVAALLGTLLIALRGHLWDRRRGVIIGLLLLVGGNLLTAGMQGPVSIGSARFVAGLGEGVTVGLFAAALAGFPQPDRQFGLASVLTLLVGAGAYRLVPVMLEWQGIAGLFLCLSVPALLALLASAAFPARPLGRAANAAPGNASRTPLRSGAGALAGGTIAFYLSVGGVWPYMGQIGISTHLSVEEISAIFSYAQIWGAVAALLPIVMGDRFGRTWPIAASVSLGAVCLLLMLGRPGQPWVFALSAQAFMFGWLLFFAYLMGLTSSLDPLGRLSSLVYSAQSVGFLLGPVICAQAILIGGYQIMLWFGVLCFATTLAALAPLAIKLDRRDAKVAAMHSECVP